MEIPFNSISFRSLDNKQSILYKIYLKDKKFVNYPFFNRIKEINFQEQIIYTESIFDYFDTINFDNPFTYSHAFFYFLTNAFSDFTLNNLLILFLDYFTEKGYDYTLLLEIVNSLHSNLVIPNFEKSFSSLKKDLENLIENKMIIFTSEISKNQDMIDQLYQYLPNELSEEINIEKIDLSIFILTNDDLSNLTCTKNIVFIENFQKQYFSIYKKLTFYNPAWSKLNSEKVKQNNILQFVYFYESYNYFNTIQKEKEKFIICFLSKAKVLHITFTKETIHEKDLIVQSLIKYLRKQFSIFNYYILPKNYDISTSILGQMYIGIFYSHLLLNHSLLNKLLFLNERTNTFHNLIKKISYTFNPLFSFEQENKTVKYNFIIESIKKQTWNLKCTIKNIINEGDFIYYINFIYASLIIFNEQYTEIYQFYKSFFPEIKKEKITSIQAIENVSKKSGEKIHELQKIYPKIFSKAYTSGCQQFRQPRHFYSKDKSKMLDLVNGNEHRLLNYPSGSDDWYVCLPAEEKEKNIQFIGLTKIIKHEKNFMYPYFPCCFPVDQYNKETSQLNKYLMKSSNTKIKNVNYDKENRVFNIDYISITLSVIRKTGGLANLPYFIDYIFKNGGMRYLTKGSQVISEFLVCSPILEFYDSFFYWIEYIRNPKFKYFSDDKKLDYVLLLRKQCAEFENYNFAKQEMFMFSDEEIRKKLLKFKTYTDPKLFYSFFRKILGIDLILVEVTDLNTSGNIVYPNYNNFYIPPFFDEANKFSVMFIYFNNERNIYYCFLLIKVKRFNNYDLDMELAFSSKESKAIKTLVNFYNIMNKIYIIKDKKYKRIKYI